MTYTKPYFREYWTPQLGLVLFWGYAALVGIGAGLQFYAGQWATGFVYLAAIFVVRMAIETILVVFEIRNVLTDIRDREAARSEPPSAPPVRAPMSQKVATPVKPGEMRLE